MIAKLVAALLASTPAQSCGSTLYGYRAADVYPSTGRVIGHGDSMAGGKTIWFQRSPRLDTGVAHRTLALGSWVIVENPKTGDREVLRVIDRGPWGKLAPDGKWFVDTTRKAPGTYRGCLDLTYPAGVLLHHSGRQRVRYWPVPQRSALASELDAVHGKCPPRPGWRRKDCPR